MIDLHLNIQGQLNRPSITPAEEFFTSNGDELTTDHDGTLVNLSIIENQQ